MTNDDAREVLNVRDLDTVSGGFIHLPLVAYKVSLAGKGDEGTGGGMNDPAQMFQQIMQQLTQGQ